jgi:microcin C transport system substrate-binding protein
MTKTRNALTSLSLLFAIIATPAAAAVDAQHGLAMHGDVKYPAGFSHFDYVNPDAPKGGELRMAVVANGYDSFNPFVARGIAAAGVDIYLYDTLLASSDDEPFSVYGLIAESIETPDDRSYVVYNLREEARFQDGEPITAEDVKFSFELLTENGHPRYQSYYQDVSKVTVESPRRVRFDFSGTVNRELPLILGQLPILPRHYWKDRTFGENGLDKPVGSGPYELGKFEAGRSVSFKRVEEYWARDLGPRKGRFNFDTITYEYYTDDTVALESFRAGNYDYRVESQAKNWATAYTGEAFDAGKINKEAIEHNRPAGMQAFVYNTRRDVFEDPAVRQALAYGFDFQWANKNLFFGQYTRTKSYFVNSELASSGLPEGRELEILEPYSDRLPASVFTTAYEPPSTAGDRTMRDNLRDALAQLREAGYAIKDGTMIHTATGRALAFEIMLFQKTFERVVLPFKNNLKKLGIEVSVRLVDSNQYAERWRTRDFDMTVGVFPQSDSPGNEQRGYWHSSSADRDATRNLAGVSEPVVDELVEFLIGAPSREELVQRTRALDRVLLHGHYVIPNWYLDSDRIAYWSFLKRPETVPKNGADVNNWWVER